VSDLHIARDRLHEVASLPVDDPLREAILREAGDPDLEAACAAAEAEEPRLRARLGAVRVPDLHARLLAVPGARRGSRRPWLVAAAAVLLAFLLGLWLGRVPKALELEPIVIAEIEKDACERAAPDAQPRVVAIKFWHELCPACKQLDPRYAGVLDGFDDGSVLFVTFDMSTEWSRQQSALMAEMLGVKDLYEASLGDFGFVALLAADDRRPLGRITAKQDERQMERSIRDALVLADATRAAEEVTGR
jgi:thiol-disulfide isomerase/thioredoxin